jgi:hypothetical protein
MKKNRPADVIPGKILRGAAVVVCLSSFLFLIYSLVYTAPRRAGIEDVLAHKTVMPATPVNSTVKFLSVVFGLSLLAVTYESFRGYRKFLKLVSFPKMLPKVLTQVEDEPAASLNLGEENKNLLYLNEELDRENARLQAEKDNLEKDIRKLEEALKTINRSEELMRKSNDALRKGYEKLVQEKETLISDLNKKEWELRELSATGNRLPLKAPLPEGCMAAAALKTVAEIKKRKAVENLINEVDAMLSRKKNRSGRGAAKTKVLKEEGQRPHKMHRANKKTGRKPK